MRSSMMTLVFLAAGLLSCKKSPPVVPVTTTGAAAGQSGSATTTPAGPDRAAARAANTAGMKLYKEKNYAGAGEKFRAAIAADSSFVLSHYNLACVAALLGDKEASRAQLDFLAQSSDAYARAKLAKAAGDVDMKSMLEDSTAGPILRWGEVFLGYRPLATGDSATEAEAKVLDKEAPGQDDACDSDGAKVVHALKAELFADHPGKETLLLSLADGAIVLDASGKVVAKNQGFSCVGSESGIRDVSIGQVVSDDEPEIVIRYVSGGRADFGEVVEVLKRKGQALTSILTVSVSESSRKWKANESTWEELGDSGKLSLSPDWLVRSRSDAGKPSETKKWDTGKFAFVAVPIVEKPIPITPPLPLAAEWELHDEKSGPCACVYATPKGWGPAKFSSKGDKNIGVVNKDMVGTVIITAQLATTTPAKVIRATMNPYEEELGDPNEKTNESGWACETGGVSGGQEYVGICAHLQDHPAGGKQVISIVATANPTQDFTEFTRSDSLRSAASQISGVNAKKGK